MSSKNRWLWELYFYFIFYLALRNSVHLFSSNSEEYLYYFILRNFNPVFYFAYFAHVMQVLLTLIHCIPLALYIYRIRFLNPMFWQFLFIARCVFEIFGHSYSWKMALAYHKSSPPLLVLILLSLILPYIPSYIVCYRYAFSNGHQE